MGLARHLGLRTLDILVGRPGVVLLLAAAVVSLLSGGLRDLRLDASRDALVVADDPDLLYFDRVEERFGTSQPIVLTYAPRAGDLLAPQALVDLRRFQDRIQEVDGVRQVLSILDVPLFRNPPSSLAESWRTRKTLEDPETDLGLARAELLQSPLYRELLVDRSLSAAALVVDLEEDVDAQAPGRILASLREVVATEALSGANIHMGGVPMVVEDILSYIASDLWVFGVGILVLLALALLVVFRRWRWVWLPLTCCLLSGLVLSSCLGLLGWEVSVVSSNYLSLQMIFTLSLVVHVLVRLQQLEDRPSRQGPHEDLKEAIRQTFVPCLFATLTTGVGFLSLSVSGLVPVADFGAMMVLGVGIALVTVFTVLPALMGLLPVEGRWHPPRKPGRSRFLKMAAHSATREGGRVLVLAALMACFAVSGLHKLEVENSFVDYFKEDSAISAGMRFLDRELGGTTPVEVIVSFPEHEDTVGVSTGAVDPDFGDFEGFDMEPGELHRPSYWLTRTKLQPIQAVHRHLATLEGIGKVRSIVDVVEIGQEANGGEPLDDLLLSVLMDKVSALSGSSLIDPFVAPEHGEARIEARVRDSDPDLRRSEMLDGIRADLTDALDGEGVDFRVTGMMVLYDNMLQGLWAAQAGTVGWTLLGLGLMFLALFRSWKTAAVALLPGLLACSTVLGFMGWWGIPLDFMTLTIVAIGTGIAVDDTIHYLHRLREERRRGAGMEAAVRTAHGTVGRAMTITTVCIGAGFSVLLFSNFIPSVLFGTLTAMAMGLALLASLTLLPALVIRLHLFPELGGRTMTER